MKIFSLFIVSFLFTLNLTSQISNIWQFDVGGEGKENVNAIKVDSEGNTFVCGNTNSQNFDFDPSLLDYILSNQISWDIFFAKYNPEGQLLWARILPGEGTNGAEAMDIDVLDGVILTGTFTDEADFDHLNGYLLDTDGDNDVFVVKYNSIGIMEYAFNLEGDGHAQGKAISQNSPETYLAGNLSDSTDFDPGPGIYKLAPQAGGSFIAKYNGATMMWAKIIDATGYTSITDITNDSDGFVYITGSFRDTLDLIPGPGENLVVADETDGYLIKLNYLGEYQWGITFTGEQNDFINTVEIRDDDKIVVAGSFQNTIDFDPGVGEFIETSSSGHDPFVAMLNEDGSLYWYGVFDNVGDGRFNSVKIDADLTIYCSGYFNGSFVPEEEILQYSNGGDDVVVVKLTQDGNLINSLIFGSSATDVHSTRCTGLSGNDVIVGGTFYGAMDFGPGTEVLAGEDSWGDTDMFLAKFNIDNYVGIDENDLSSSYILYPSPSSGVINFHSDNNFVAYEIIDIQGRIVDHGNIEKPFSIDISSVESGEYLLKYENKVQRFIIR